jgi:hypothetical protein
VVDLLRTLGFEHGWVGREALPEDLRSLPPEQFQMVVDAVFADVKRQAEEDILLNRHLFDGYLYFWSSAAGEGEPTAYLRTFLDGTNRVAALLRALTGPRRDDRQPLNTDALAVALDSSGAVAGKLRALGK